MGIDVKPCRMCLKEFLPTRSSHLYCSSPCSSKAVGLKIYGLSPEDYRTLVEATGGKCPICKRNTTRWNVDHSHVTGETLGVVCSQCNTVLLAGSRHDLDTAERLVDYLKNPPVRILGERVSDLEKLKKRKSHWSPPRWKNGDNSRKRAEAYEKFAKRAVNG